MKVFQIQISEAQRDFLRAALSTKLDIMPHMEGVAICETMCMGHTLQSTVREENQALFDMLDENTMIKDGMNDFTS